MVGIDQSGRVLEMVVLVFDSGGELLIHAMKARPQFLDELT
ncbi:putative toxin-antitoxin system, toxin component [Actinomyces sp. ICM58]|nr:putative toxin-antitoxin system, toxin component [Actinomyces sp. ICM58]